MNPLINAFHLLPESVQDKVRSIYPKVMSLPRVPLPSHSELVWVSPKQITYRVKKGFHIKGEVVSGDWDKLDTLFEDYDFYQAVIRHYQHGIAWKETDFYNRIITDNTYGSTREAHRRLRLWDAMYIDMMANGYRLDKCTRDHITINIGRYGDILFNDGGHRLAIAKVLHIKQIPVEIMARHTEWERFREEVGGYAESKGDMVYSPLTHPDLSHTPYSHGPERFEMIRDSIDNMHGDKRSVLDIGAHWGYFCHRLEDLGYECTAVESAELHLHFLNKLKRAENRRFQIQPMDVLNFGKGTTRWKYDVVLALAIFHHFLKRGKLEELKALLGKLECQEMYFQPHRENESQMVDELEPSEYKSPEEMVQFILDNSCLTQSRQIGTTSDDGRGIWKLWQ